MVSLTTVYILSVILTSVAGIGAAFASDRLVGGGTASLPLEPNTVQTLPVAEEELDLRTD